MAIISANRNPKNDSLYARRRSVFKGKTKQLENIINGLKNASDKVIFEEFTKDGGGTPVALFNGAWGMGEILRGTKKIDPKAFTPKVERIPNDELKSDFRLIFADFTKLKMRFTQDDQDRGYICMFVGTNRLELIASKWGVAASARSTPNLFSPAGTIHHFYHWQAVARGGSVQQVITVDDSSLSEDSSESGSDKKGELLKTLTTAGLW
jgi:hypothetical protein